MIFSTLQAHCDGCHGAGWELPRHTWVFDSLPGAVDRHRAIGEQSVAEVGVYLMKIRSSSVSHRMSMSLSVLFGCVHARHFVVSNVVMSVGQSMPLLHLEYTRKSMLCHHIFCLLPNIPHMRINQ